MASSIEKRLGNIERISEDLNSHFLYIQDTHPAGKTENGLPYHKILNATISGWSGRLSEIEQELSELKKQIPVKA